MTEHERPSPSNARALELALAIKHRKRMQDSLRKATVQCERTPSKTASRALAILRDADAVAFARLKAAVDAYPAADRKLMWREVDSKLAVDHERHPRRTK